MAYFTAKEAESTAFRAMFLRARMFRRKKDEETLFVPESYPIAYGLQVVPS